MLCILIPFSPQNGINKKYIVKCISVVAYYNMRSDFWEESRERVDVYV